MFKQYRAYRRSITILRSLGTAEKWLPSFAEWSGRRPVVPVENGDDW